MAIVQPIDYTSGNGFAQGLQLKGLQDEIQQRALAVDQARLAAEQQAQFQQEWQSSFGDPQKMTALAAKYPQQLAAIKAGIGFQDEQHQMALGNAARDLRIAMATGNPQAVLGAAMKHSQTLVSINSSPEEIVQQFQNDPQSLAHTVDAVGLSALGAKDYYGVENDRAQRQNDQEKLAEQIRSNQASEALTARGQNISAQNARLAAYAPTSAMQNYSQYAQMLKSDPDGAAVFAQAAGINTAGKKLMKVEKNDDGSITKYYTDGTEESGKLNQPIKEDGMRIPLSSNQADAILGKASEGAKQAAGFAMRIRQSQDVVKNLIDSGAVSPERAAFISQNLGDGMLANTALSPAEQTYLINAKDINNAILRKDTGAAITDAETREYAKLYLPQPGDSPAARRAKEQKIEQRFKTFRGESGRVYEAMIVSSKAYDQQEAKSLPAAQPQQASPSIVDGATATNPSTGQKIIFRGGRWQPM